MKRFDVFVLLVVALSLLAVPVAGAQQLKNVIIMIADGWGMNDILTNNYWNGVAAQPYQQFPVSTFMSTYSWTTLEQDPTGYDPAQAWSNFYYMLLRPTDSASAATAMSTGVKIRDHEVNVDPIDFHALFTVTERAEQLGKSTGVVTSVEWSHATPAGFSAHDIDRSNYASIAVEMLDSTNLEVIMGCGHPFYDENGLYRASPNYQYVGGAAKWNQLTSGTHPLGWTLLQSKAQFEALQSGPTPARVCGTAQVYTTLQQVRAGGEAGNQLRPPYTVPLLTTVPSLATMARGAINVLDNDPDGFLLMIEGGAVDWANHSNQMGRMIEELDQFNAAVQAVIEWVELRSNWNETLLIVTGDHETGYLWGPNSGSPARWNPIVNNGPHQMPGCWYYTGNHSNSLIPLFAKGIGAEYFRQWSTGNDPVRGPYMDNTRIAQLIFGYFDERLAVNLLSFEATARGNAVELNWSTAAEVNNDHFEVLRDGDVRSTITARGGASGADYSWLDHDVESGHSYRYTLVSVDAEGTREELATVQAAPLDAAAAVVDYALNQNYPNPFNPVTNITFDLPVDDAVTLTVFDISGREVAKLLSGLQRAGRHTVSFDASSLPSGVYLYRLQTGQFSAGKRMLLIK